MTDSAAPLDVTPKRKFKRVAIVFSGGPAPSANAVISTAAATFLRDGTEVLGMRHGYSRLDAFDPAKPLQEGEDYLLLSHDRLARTRNSQGILIGTARTNPGRNVKSPADLQDAKKLEPLRRVYNGLRSLGVEALISIGGDDTLTTANKFKLFQDQLPSHEPRVAVVHLPKTIDNDLPGLDFTFGYFTAVGFIAEEIRNLIYDAQATEAYFIAEVMGRSAGWLAYGAAIAGEASLVISSEDITAASGLRTREWVRNDPKVADHERDMMVIDKVLDWIVDVMIKRDSVGKSYGVVALAEGLVGLMPWEYIKDLPRDDHGHPALGKLGLGRKFAELVEERYKKRSGKKRKVTGMQLGYEARCAKPHAVDVILGSSLGVGAYRALAQNGLNGVLVSWEKQFQLRFVPFEELVDQKTLRVKVRTIETGSDLHLLARFLELYVNVKNPPM